ncbi:hypothetical protein [Aquimarina celericrescens]|uniref:Uncharacterized protein n=1 Tax=Aquimarina celericrescens TaxID=1964542 RepID=A0ABW5B1E3_9FLAO
MSAFISCDEEEAEQELLKKELSDPGTRTSVVIRDNQLVFSSVEVFESMIENDQVTTSHLNSILNQNYNNFNSLYKKLNNEAENLYYNQTVYGFDNEEESPILNILNENEMVTIGDWVFKVDLTHQIVGVTWQGNQNVFDALSISDFNEDRIYWFGTEDDVLLLLEEGSEGTLNREQLEDRINKAIQRTQQITTKSYCSFNNRQDSSTNFLKDKKIIISTVQCGDSANDCIRYEADMKHVYQKAGIYFSLQSKIKYRSGGSPQCAYGTPGATKTTLSTVVSYYYERRRRFRRNEKKSGSLNDYQLHDNRSKVRSYRGTRSLKHYRLNTTFTYRRRDACVSICGPGPQVTVAMPQIAD